MTTPTLTHTDPATAIRAGSWVRFPDWEQWRYVHAARHTPFDPAEPRGTGYVHYDATGWPGHRLNYYGFADHTDHCHVITITPQAVAA